MFSGLLTQLRCLVEIIFKVASEFTRCKETPSEPVKFVEDGS